MSRIQQVPKSRTVVCYICGREFGSASIEIHEPQCLVKWKAENNRLPKSQRRPIPQKVSRSQLSRTEYNEIAEQSFKAQLIPCPTCARRFLPDRLEVHQRSCAKNKATNRGDTQPSQYNKPSAQVIVKPKTVICYICGREYGTKSISIHEPQCLVKWHRQNEQLPRELRQKEPTRPKERSVEATGSYNLANYNESAWEASKANMAACRKCGRTFNPDRLPVHERVCKNI